MTKALHGLSGQNVVVQEGRAQLAELTLLARFLEPETTNGGLARKLSPSQTTLGRHFPLRRRRRREKQPLLEGGEGVSF